MRTLFPPPASLAAGHRSCDMVDTHARFNVKDVGKINFFIYIFDLTTRGGDEDTCHLQASTPSSLQHLRPGPRVGAPRTRSGCVVVAGFLGGSRGLADTPRFTYGGGTYMPSFFNPPPHPSACACGCACTCACGYICAHAHACRQSVVRVANMSRNVSTENTFRHVPDRGGSVKNGVLLN